MNGNKTRVAIYCRLSEEDRNKASAADDSVSIQNQKRMLLQYSKDHSWEVFGIYSDDDYTGSDRNRPQFRQLLQDAEQRKFEVVLCKTQSRFTRELELVEKYIHGLFPMWGIRFVSVVDNADSENKGNKKSRQINGLVNEWYLEDMSENIKSVLNNRRQNGYHIGSFALYGYQKDPIHKGRLIVDPEAASTVQTIFSLFAQGYGKTAIARMLNERRIPNPSEYKRLHGLRYHQPQNQSSTLWKYATISAMLSNEIYIGNMVQGKYGSVSYKTKQNKPRPRAQWYRVEQTHEPIIDPQLWAQVQKLLQSRAKPFKCGRIGLFAGMTRCAACGHTLRSVKSRGRHYLQCPTRQISKDACPGAFISVEKLEKLVLSHLKQLTDCYLDRDELVLKLKQPDKSASVETHLNHQINVLQKQLEDYDSGLSSLYMDKVRGIISENEYMNLSTEFRQKHIELQNTLADCESQLKSFLDREAEQSDPLEFIRRITTPDELSREMVELAIDRIVVYTRISGTRITPVEIHWNF